MLSRLHKLLLICLISKACIAPAQAGMSMPGQLSVNASGAATYTIPIVMAPGTAGLAPKLQLNYDSQGGNGQLGMGWGLGGLSVMSRCGQTMAQDGRWRGVNYDEQDRYCLDGQRLIAVNGAYGAHGTEYRTEQEGFSKIVSYGAAGKGPAWFKVWTKSGQIMEYGCTEDAKIEAQGSQTARLWALNKVLDTSGNYFAVSYAKDPTNGSYHPLRIDYTGNANTGTIANSAVLFHYEPKPDPSEVMIAGSVIRNKLRLARIDTVAGGVRRHYSITYAGGPLSQIASIAWCASDTQCLPATHFGWQAGGGAHGLAGEASWGRLAAGTNWRLTAGDANGDSLSDLLAWNPDNGAVYIAYSSGSALRDWMPVLTAPPLRNGGFVNLSLGDVNGDGRADIVAANGMVWLAGLQGFSAVQQWSRNAPEQDGLRVTVADANGDGFGDLLSFDPASGSLNIAYSYGSGFRAGIALELPQAVREEGYSDVTLGDINGDGLADLVAGNGTIRLSTGNGFAPAQQWRMPPFGTLPRIVVSDLNGDSFGDLLAFQGNDLYVAFSDGNSFGSVWQPIGPAPSGRDSDYFSLAFGDLNGDGRVDIAAANGQVRLAMARSPDLLHSIYSGLGVSTLIHYKPITDDSVYTPDSNARYPVRDIERQGPIYVVSQILSPDGAGDALTTDYTYGGLKSDTSGQGSLGFRWIQAMQANSGIATRTTYRQDWPYVGLPAEVATIMAGSGSVKLLKLLNYDYGCKDFVNTDGCYQWPGRRYFRYTKRSTEKAWDLNGADLPGVSTITDYDDWGNATRIKTASDDGFYKTTSNTYVNDVASWLLGRLTLASVAATGAPAAGDTHVPTGIRTVGFDYYPGTGLLARETVEPGNPQYQIDTIYTYDAWGNRITSTVSSPATGSATITPRSSSTTYDARGQFAIRSTNAAGHSETRTVIPASGALASLTGPNGLSTTWEYDHFGRKIRERRADGTGTRWDYLHCIGLTGGTASCGGHARYLVQATPVAADGVTPNGAWSRTWFDALDREIRRDTLGFDAALIAVETEYDRLGRVRRTSRPYAAGQSPQWTENRYDELDRIVVSTAPDGSQTSYDYNGLTTSVTVPTARTSRKLTNSQSQLRQTEDAAGNFVNYAYDAFGNLVRTIDPKGKVVRLSYDVRGRKIQMIDPDMGSWNYAYNALGELVAQTDAKGQVTTMVYDKLGRMTSRIEPDLRASWEYDFCPGGIGKLCRTEASNGYQRSHHYDHLGRGNRIATTIDTTYNATVSFDANGRIATRTYPTGLVIRYGYTPLGYLAELRNHATNALIWRADRMNAEGKLLQQTYGNNVVTQQRFNLATGRLENITAGPNDSVQNFTYSYNPEGLLSTRYDAERYLEVFNYDKLDRLTSSATWNTSYTFQTTLYDTNGNILERSGVGSYSYGDNGIRPHAVSSLLLPNGGRRHYRYDANGNLTEATEADAAGVLLPAKSRSVRYTSFNMPHTLSTPATSVSFTYDSEHQRVMELTPGLSTIFLHPDNTGGLFYEKDIKANGAVEHRHFITAGSDVVAVIKQSGSTSTMRYFHRDHLGSTTAITDESGTVVERLSYEPFGKRRQSNGAIDFNDKVVGIGSDRGFTNHEHLDELGLIHMNGRIYDPFIARFMTPDPFIQAGDFSQSFNRYSYVMNSPLNATDPSGYLSLFGQRILPGVFNNKNARVLVSILSTLACSYATAGIGTAACVGGSQTVIGKASGASWNQALRSGLIAGATAYSFFLVGEAFPGLGQNGATLETRILNTIGHSAVGCASAAASGGSCGAGAMAGGFSAAFGNYVGYSATLEFATIQSAIVGGVASELGGGKFANGAVTGAFGYLFNHCSHVGNCWKAFKDSATMAKDWALGTGPNVRVFGPGSTQVIDMVDAPGVNGARERLYNTNAQSVTNYRAGFGLLDFLTTSSPTQQFVGSYRVDVFTVNNGTDLMFVLNNNSSFKSLGYGITPDWERSTFEAGGNMRQTYWWIERRRP